MKTMARKKVTPEGAISETAGSEGAEAAAAAKGAEPDKKKQRVVIQPKNAMEWGAIIKKVKNEHWRTIRVTIQIREWMLAGKPASLDVAEKMLKARGLDDQIEALPEDAAGRAEKAEEVVLEGLCEFFRRPGKLGPTGKEGIWFPTNHLKAGIKENWSVLGYRNEIRGSRGAIAEGLFVYAALPPGAPTEERDWIWLGEGPKAQHTAIAHTMSPKGPVHSLKRHEYVEKVQFSFDVAIARVLLEANKIPDEKFADMLVHYGEHGMGACRSQGFGKFDMVSVEDIALTEGEHLKVGAPQLAAAG
jgi:hypothetical protein